MNMENAWILERGKALYGVDFVGQNTMGNSGNKIFEVRRGQTPYILRAAAYSRESEAHLSFELNWMAYLADGIEGIVRPGKSLNGNLYEVIQSDDGKAYALCLLEKAVGKLVDIDNADEFNEALFYDLGALMGEMHRRTVDYKGNVRKSEFEWTGSVNAWRYQTPISDGNVRARLEQYYKEIQGLPISGENYGIIHMDIHTDNFFVDDGKITLFDFDACQFNWYAADIASALFFMIQKGAGPMKHTSEQERTAFAEAYTISYLKGYLETNAISKYWIGKLELFMKYQMGDEYLFAQSFWPEELSHLQEWYLCWHKERIANGLPYAFIDYAKVINSIPSVPSV